VFEFKEKKKPRGKPFPKGVSGNPKGNPESLAKAREAARNANRTFAEQFLKEMHREVPAIENGVPIKAKNYKLFVQQMIAAGIKGGTGTQARKLVLEFLALLVAEEKKAAEGENVEAFSWDDAKEKLYQRLKAAGRAK
jgi:hypothetical protein